MPKGYWIGHVTVTNPEGYKEYVAANAEPLRKYGGRFLVRGGKYETRSGTERQRHVIVEFDSFDQAKACYDCRNIRRRPKSAMRMRLWIW